MPTLLFNMLRLSFAFPSSRCCDKLSVCLQLEPIQLNLIHANIFPLSRFLPHGAVTSFLIAVQPKLTLLDLTHANINFNAFRLCFTIPSSRCCDNLSVYLQLKPTQLNLTHANINISHVSTFYRYSFLTVL